MPTDGYRHAGATGEVAYGSREFEKAVAAEMRLRHDSGREADRAAVVRDLVNSGKVRTEFPSAEDLSTLAEAQAIQSAERGAQRGQSASGRAVRLAEQTPDEAYERTYNTKIAQGYSPSQARYAAEFVALEAKRLADQRLPGAR
jgi:hypothetical protein